MAETRTPLTLSLIVDQAVDMADREGLDGLSMRRLGSELGVKAMSLYHHVPNKETLLTAMVDRVLSEVQLPDPSIDWREAVRERYMSQHQVLVAHPWATLLLVRMMVTPLTVRIADWTIAALRAGGLDFVAVDRIWTALDGYLYGFTLQATRSDLCDDVTASIQRHQQLLEDGQYPALQAMSAWAMSEEYPGPANFEAGLEVLLVSERP